MKAELKRKQGKYRQDSDSSTIGQRVRREVVAWIWVALVFMLVNGAVQANVINKFAMTGGTYSPDNVVLRGYIQRDGVLTLDPGVAVPEPRIRSRTGWI